MAFADLLVNVLTAYRADGTLDRMGQPTAASTAGASNYVGKCRVSAKTGGRVQGDRTIQQFENNWTVFLVAGADVREDDIVMVSDQATGEIIMYGLVQSRYDVYAGASTVHHVELGVFEQTGPEDAPSP